MSWEQDLVYAQVSVNRAVFEHNRRGLLPPLQAEPRKDYILNEMRCAALDLERAIEQLETELK